MMQISGPHGLKLLQFVLCKALVQDDQHEIAIAISSYNIPALSLAIAIFLTILAT